MRRLALLAAGLSIMAQAALAADLRPPVVTAPPPSVFTWTGCYGGGHGGGLWVHKNYVLSGVAGGAIGGIVFPGVDFGGHDVSSGLAGLQLGCNYQFAGGFVIGIQSDYAWGNANGSHVDPLLALTTLTSKTRSLASTTVRIGYAWDRFLGYVKGGGALERDDYSWFVTGAPAVALAGSDTRGGWTVGIGAEYAFLDWLTGFIEYDYYQFGTSTVALSGTGVNPPNFDSFNFDIRERKSVVKAGINFKFGGGPVRY